MKPSTIACIILLVASTVAATEVKPKKHSNVLVSALKGVKNLIVPKAPKSEPVIPVKPQVERKTRVPDLFLDMNDLLEPGAMSIYQRSVSSHVNDHDLKGISWAIFYPWIKTIVQEMVKSQQEWPLDPALQEASVTLLYNELQRLKENAEILHRKIATLKAKLAESEDYRYESKIMDIRFKLTEMGDLAHDIVACIKKLDPTANEESESQ